MTQTIEISRRGFGALLAAGIVSACSESVSGGGLRVADQLNALQNVLQASGQIGSIPKTAWSNFIGGPSIIAAATGNSIDLGWMAETPLVFAQAAGSPVKVVAVARAARDESVSAGMAIVVRPNSPLRSAADLKGKRLVYSSGTILQYFCLRALQEGGLGLNDVEQVTVSPGAVESLLATGKVDAVATVEPYLSTLIVPGKARVLVAGGAPLTPELYYLVAPDAALADPARSAQIGAFVESVARAFAWWRDNPEQAGAAAARFYKQPAPVANSIALRTARRLGPLTPDVIAAQQAEGDAFQRLGLIRTRIDAAALYDRRYDAALGKLAEAAA